MLEFCPLCMKNGLENKVRIFQLNLEEAVWACEAPDCVWPIGYEDLTFIRNVLDLSNEGGTSSSTENVPDNTKQKSSSEENVLINTEETSFSRENVYNTFPAHKKQDFLERTFKTETSSSEVNSFSDTEETNVCKKIVSTNTEETNSSRETIPIPMELSLYTPPVTPMGGELSKEVNMSILSPENASNLIEDKSDELLRDESISSVKQFKKNVNHLSTSELSEGEIDNFIKKSENIEKEESKRAGKVLPKITNIEKTNIDLKIYSDKTERYKAQDDSKQQECTEVFTNTLVTEVAKDYNILTDYKWCNESGLDEQQKENKKDESNNNQVTQRLQPDNTEIITVTNSCKEVVPGAQPVINTYANLDTSNCSSLNISSDLNFEDILGDISSLNDDNMMEKIDTEWLKFLES
ncbi:uncharacterized protein LOC109863631 [Pseudomyrmex gracilis]|uniref:uncharacterized protein LOC109863631 n=1 Tax=Pseudomyrmex gracilis TaxID=219809 RepID=UPI0009956C0D|nr:uncharacterized protein LOC109863631 [Pseudomyrmex gracilis]